MAFKGKPSLRQTTHVIHFYDNKYVSKHNFSRQQMKSCLNNANKTLIPFTVLMLSLILILIGLDVTSGCNIILFEITFFQP